VSVCQITTGMEKEEEMYYLKVQKKCNGSNSKWCEKGRKGIQTENVE
jgi:hypothetical protein